MPALPAETDRNMLQTPTPENKMKTRTKKIVTSSIRDRSDLETAVGFVAETMLEAEAMRIELERKIKTLREEYEGRAAALSERIDAKTDDIAAYVSLHPDVIPAGRKSLDLLHGTIGYRTGMPRVSLPRGKDPQEVIDDLLSSGLGQFVRTAQEVNKAAVIDAPDFYDVLMSHGIRVTQTETFYVAPKLETPAQ